MAQAEISIDDQITAAVQRSPYLSHRNLRIESHEGRVTIRGVVPSYYQKLMAQEALRRVQGVAQIENHLEVNWANAAAS
jgi:osmotically-inducible protein OsmY